MQTIIKEEPLKNEIYQRYFKAYRYTQIGNIDFVIAKHNTLENTPSLFEDQDNVNIKSLLWAEAKKGNRQDIYESFIQLILTIGKEKTFEKYLPPKYIGAFDAEKFAFIEYNKIQQVFYQNDFNWNVTPSDHKTKEFVQLYELCESSLEENKILFNYAAQESEFKGFIQINFKITKEETEKISITKNNFTFVFQKWNEKVKPTIAVDWKGASRRNILPADFFLADLLSDNSESIKDSLFVVLKKTKYELAKKIDEYGFETFTKVGFMDNQKAYKEFWSVYKRPPKEEYWEYILSRRDLLVPPNIREIKGSYFTPQKWVEKSQQYLADVLGENWQDEYYIWDCCAGTGNMENGLINASNVWASTIDQADVDVMKDRVGTGLNMFEDHIFQFDFLNDGFSKCPEELQKILNDEEKRKKLVIYINPPYKEATSSRSIVGSTSRHIANVAECKIKNKYQFFLKQGAKELFILFVFRCYKEINGAFIAHFSTIKALQGNHYQEFRDTFLAKLEKLFIVPANTFDNVHGKFPIGFHIWNTQKVEKFERILIDIYEAGGQYIGNKEIKATSNKNIKDWLRLFYDNTNDPIGWLVRGSSDVQNNNIVFITSKPSISVLKAGNASRITPNNLVANSIFYSVRKVIEDTWINDRDQYYFPNDKWTNDKEFQSNCVVYSLFAESNTIKSSDGINHWIPFTEQQVASKKSFKSHFMSDFLNGKVIVDISQEKGFNFNSEESKRIKFEKVAFSQEAQAVYDSGLAVWKYYFTHRYAEPNSSFYDIRLYFQGKNQNGKMKNHSEDNTYERLIGDLRNKMKVLALRIKDKVYEYEFLK